MERKASEPNRLDMSVEKCVELSLTILCVTILMPKGVGQVITSIERRFLWSGTYDVRKISKVSWNVVVQ
jgi:hypothetical protein